MARGARLVLVLFAAALLIAPARADACSCDKLAPPCEMFWTTPLVFSGGVTSVERVEDDLRVRFHVDRAWRGEVGDEVIVTTPSLGSMCGVPFDAGASYVVFARQQNGRWTTHMCSGTVAVANAAETLAYLNRSDKEASGGRVFGTARFLETRAPAAGLKITLSDAKLGRTTFSRTDGSFEFTNVPAGTYRMELPFGARSSSSLIELADARGCALANVVMSPAQLTIQGSVVRPNSRAAPNVKIALYSADPSRQLAASIVTDRRGEFSVSVPAGRRYVVVGSIGGERGEVGPFELTAATAPVLVVLRKQ